MPIEFQEPIKIPMEPQPEASQPEPIPKSKKRGRKRVKKQEQKEEEEQLQGEDEEEKLVLFSQNSDDSDDSSNGKPPFHSNPKYNNITVRNRGIVVVSKIGIGESEYILEPDEEKPKKRNKRHAAKARTKREKQVSLTTNLQKRAKTGSSTKDSSRNRIKTRDIPKEKQNKISKAMFDQSDQDSYPDLHEQSEEEFEEPVM